MNLAGRILIWHGMVVSSRRNFLMKNKLFLSQRYCITRQKSNMLGMHNSFVTKLAVTIANEVIWIYIFRSCLIFVFDFFDLQNKVPFSGFVYAVNICVKFVQVYDIPIEAFFHRNSESKSCHPLASNQYTSIIFIVIIETLRNQSDCILWYQVTLIEPISFFSSIDLEVINVLPSVAKCLSFRQSIYELKITNSREIKINLYIWEESVEVTGNGWDTSQTAEWYWRT